MILSFTYLHTQKLLWEQCITWGYAAWICEYTYAILLLYVLVFRFRLCTLLFFTPFFAARSHSSFDIRCSQNHIAHLPPLNIYNYRTIPRHDDARQDDDDTVSAAQQFAVREYIEVGNIDVMMIAYNICVFVLYLPAFLPWKSLPTDLLFVLPISSIIWLYFAGVLIFQKLSPCACCDYRKIYYF